MPDAGNPQAFNRYTYVLNRPLLLRDSTGHFSEKELTDWFGENWEQLFDSAWQTLLLQAELGDIVTDFRDGFLFSLAQGSLAFWDLAERSRASVVEKLAMLNPGSTGLYRPAILVNSTEHSGNGPSNGVFPGLATESGLDPRHIGDSFSNNQNRYVHVSGSYILPGGFQLSSDWYLGSNVHVQVQTRFAGFDIGLGDQIGLVENIRDIVTEVGISRLLSRAGPSAFGSAFLGFGLAIELSEWTLWDSVYSIVDYPGTPPIERHPEPISPAPVGTLIP